MLRTALFAMLALGACDSPSEDVEGDAATSGPAFSGTVVAAGLPLADATIELIWSGGAPLEVTTDSDGAFAYTLPQAGENYQAIMPPGEGYWGRSSWLLDVPEAGYTGIRYVLGGDDVFDGFSNVLGEPRLSADQGIVSIEIQINAAQVAGKGFSLATDADPIFTFDSSGIPVRSDVLIDGGDVALVFGNVAPQLLPPATPNPDTPCAQLAPGSEVRAKTVLILAASCE